MEIVGKKVLVTGGAGFIGSHTASALAKRGAEVVIVDNLSTGRKNNVPSGLKLHQVNIADPEVDDIMHSERPQVIYHFAFYVLVPNSVKDPLLDMDALKGSVRLLKCAAGLGVERVVFASSGFLYGNTDRLPATEETPIEPVTPYVVAKHAVENYLRCFHKTHGLPYTVLRYAAVYGPGQVTGAMADYIRKLSTGEQAEIWGDGNKTRDYVYIDDVVRANLLALELPKDCSDAVFNIGTGIETTLNAVYQKIAAILGVTPRPVYHPDRPGEQIRYSLANAKAREVIGWVPEVDLDRGLNVTVAATTGKVPAHFADARSSAQRTSEDRGSAIGANDVSR